MTNASLEQLAEKYRSDKKGCGVGHRGHGYCDLYSEQFEPYWREYAQVVVEIGTWDGRSLRMWTEYFLNAKLFGLDLPKPFLPGSTMKPAPQVDKSRVTLLHGDQSKRADLQRLIDAIGKPIDVFVDDGGHTMEQHQVTLGHVFPYMEVGGVYVVEDLYTCYYKSKYGFDWNPTKTEWDTLRLLRALAAGETFDSDFMTVEEKAYLQEHTQSIQIGKGKISEIAFIVKR